MSDSDSDSIDVCNALLFGLTKFDLSNEPDDPNNNAPTPLPSTSPSSTSLLPPPPSIPLIPPTPLPLPSPTTSRAFTLTPSGPSPPPLTSLTSPSTGSFLTSSKLIKKGSIIFTEKSYLTSSSSEIKHCAQCYTSLEPSIPEVLYEELWPDSDFVGCESISSCGIKFCNDSCSNKFRLRLPSTMSCCNYSEIKSNFKNHHQMNVLNLSFDLFLKKIVDEQDSTIISQLCGEADDNIKDLNSCSEFYDEFYEGVKEFIEEDKGFLLFKRCLAIVFRNGFGFCTKSPFSEYYSNLIRKFGRDSEEHVNAIKSVTRTIDSQRELSERGDQDVIDSKVRVECNCLFTYLAKMNHSCTPNAEVRSGGFKDDVVDVFAVKDIKKGEEVTISYIKGIKGGGERRDWIKRRRELEERYCFVCRCEVCLKI
ncbi:hypothetical protein TrLO_g14585 [Triparma laevis f. longispina]|uniref:SET domain-containing protein n=1 Tax=Triparma laevis f. longispina TaxID=1714387 RepID=A0A9W7A1M1_9STRA|nr:hypothetical protein TrLO_g14585 [Triparma laevis f. longispina]